MSENPVRHDYTRKNYKNGWAIMDFAFLDAGMAKISAFGLKRHMPHKTLEATYLLAGEEIVISMPDGEVLYEIAKISYHRDPYDMYEAELKYVQHLTGLRIVAQNDEKQRVRQIEWGRKHHSGVRSDEPNTLKAFSSAFPMNSDEELAQIEHNIRQLQRRADLLRRVRQAPHPQIVAGLQKHFRDAHFCFLAALHTYETEIKFVLSSVASELGYTKDIEYQEWLKLRKDIQPYLYDFGCVAEPFFTRTEDQVTSEVRNQIERLFLFLRGEHETIGWFNELLAREQEEDEEAAREAEAINQEIAAHDNEGQQNGDQMIADGLEPIQIIEHEDGRRGYIVAADNSQTKPVRLVL